jgi:predicted DNA-binding transcriptional regulator YafY
MLQQAINFLIDAGQIPIALELTKLLLERSELPGPLRKELEDRLDNPPPPWRWELDRCILRQQPFQLSYQDAGDRIWEFHLYHAAINRHEDRLYLDCWCEETEGNQDISELHHNWSLRIDRIPNDSLITPIPRGKWRNQLDSVSAEFQLFDGLARSYRTKTAIDIANELISNDPLVRQITRQVTSSFWFFREILPYGEDCLLISPEKVRKRFYDKLQRLYRRYES